MIHENMRELGEIRIVLIKGQEPRGTPYLEFPLGVDYILSICLKQTPVSV